MLSASGTQSEADEQTPTLGFIGSDVQQPPDGSAESW